MEHHGDLAKELVFALIILFLGRDQRILLILTLFHQYQLEKKQQCTNPTCVRFECAKSRARKKRKLEKQAKECKQEQQCNLCALLQDHNYVWYQKQRKFVMEEHPKLLCTTVASASEYVHVIPV